MDRFIDANGLKAIWDAAIKYCPEDPNYSNHNTQITFTASRSYSGSAPFEIAKDNETNLVLVVNSEGTGYEWKSLGKIIQEQLGTLRSTSSGYYDYGDVSGEYKINVYKSSESSSKATRRWTT